MQRVFTCFHIKSVDEEKREFSGVATTPTPDLMDDVVSPLGAEFTLPISLISKHRDTLPIGEVYWAKVTSAGIEYKARIPTVTEPGLLKDRVDEAWQEIKYKLIRGVSIGFKPVAGFSERLKSGGTLFKKWIWLELSTVAIPANMEANISAIKTIGQKQSRSTASRGAIKLITKRKIGAPIQLITATERAKSKRSKSPIYLKGSPNYGKKHGPVKLRSARNITVPVQLIQSTHQGITR